MSRPQPQTAVEGMPIVHPHAAGLDVGHDAIWVCVPATAMTPPVRRFATFTTDLHDLADWLAVCQVDTVAMESTGVYWLPVFEILESKGFDVKVVNARHLKHVPGRKSDVQDCQWIQRLHSCGLLTGSFRPEPQMAVLRSYLRQRAMLIEHRAAHIQHMQKALDQMNVQLSLVLSDITGKSGMAMMRAIIAGEHDAARLVALRDSNCRQPDATIRKALTGNYRPEHVFALQQALALYDAYSQQLALCDAEIEQYLEQLAASTLDDRPPLPPSPKKGTHSKNAPSYDGRQLLYKLTGVDLTAITGLHVSTIQSILAEVGTDMSRWPSEKHFCSWLGLAPHNEVSGGKVLRHRTLPTHNRAGQVFRLAAQAASRNRDSAAGAFYWRQKARLGPQKAIVATAHRIARSFYAVLRTRTPYHETGAAAYHEGVRQRELHALQKHAARLGLTLVPATAAP